METKLKQVEVQASLVGDHEFSIQHATRWQLRPQRLDHLRKISVQRLLVAALKQDPLSLSKNQHPKAVPFGLEDPVTALRQFSSSLGEHWYDRRIHGKLHSFMLPSAPPGSIAIAIQRFFI